MIEYENVLYSEDIFPIILFFIENKIDIVNLLYTSKYFLYDIKKKIKNIKNNSLKVYYPKDNIFRDKCFSLPSYNSLYTLSEVINHMDIDNTLYKKLTSFIHNPFYKSYTTYVDNINNKKKFVDIFFIFWKGQTSIDNYQIPDTIKDIEFPLYRMKYLPENNIIEDIRDINNYIYKPLIEKKKKFIQQMIYILNDCKYCDEYTKIFRYIIYENNFYFTPCPPTSSIEWICENKPVGIKLRLPFEFLEIIPKNINCMHKYSFCFCKNCTKKQNIYSI